MPPNETAGSEVLLPTYYDLDLHVDYEAEVLQGDVKIELLNPNVVPVRGLSLLPYRLLRVDAVFDRCGQELPFEQTVVTVTDFRKLQLNWIRAVLPESVAPGERTEVRIEYDGHLLGYVETGMRYTQDHIGREFTILRNDCWAFPIPGYPTMPAIHDAVRRTAHGYTVRIEVPTGLTVANGGRLERIEERERTVVYHYASVLPSNRMDFAIAQYRQSTLAPFDAFYFPKHQEAIDGALQAARRAVDLLSRWFGPLAVGTRMTLIEIPDGWGSQTDVATILQSEGAFADPKRRFELYHEICHLWDPPSTDSPSPRWNEGLASFLQFLLVERLDGQPAVDRAASGRLDRLRQGLPRHPKWAEVPLVDYGRADITELSYIVGALFFDLLYRLLGPEAFIGILKRYRTEFHATGGSTDNLVNVLRAAADVDVGDLCRDWLYTTGWTDRIAQRGRIEELLAYYADPSERR